MQDDQGKGNSCRVNNSFLDKDILHASRDRGAIEDKTYGGDIYCTYAARSNSVNAMAVTDAVHIL